MSTHFWDISVVEHTKYNSGQWIQDLVIVLGYNNRGKVVNGRRLLQHGLEVQVWTVYLRLFPVVFFELLYLYPYTVQILFLTLQTISISLRIIISIYFSYVFLWMWLIARPDFQQR